MRKVSINFDKIIEVSNKSVRRCLCFVGLGINAVRCEGVDSYNLPQDAWFKALPESPSEAEFLQCKEDFGKWIIACSLRELIEGFGVFLEKLHWACLVIENNKGELRPDQAKEWERAFERKGIEDKLKCFENRFGVTSNKNVYFASINAYRNCLTHRRGIVGNDDVDENGEMRIKWWRYFFFIDSGGKEIPMMPPFTEDGIVLEEDGILKAKIDEEEKVYRAGQVIELTINDIHEIAFLVQMTSKELFRSSIAYAQKMGVVIES